MPCNPKRTHNTELELQGSPAVAAKGRQQACKCKHKALGSMFRLPSKCSFVLAFARLSSALCSDCRTSSCECSRSSSCLYPVANCSCSCCWTLSVCVLQCRLGVCKNCNILNILSVLYIAVLAAAAAAVPRTPASHQSNT